MTQSKSTEWAFIVGAITVAFQVILSITFLRLLYSPPTPSAPITVLERVVMEQLCILETRETKFDNRWWHARQNNERTQLLRLREAQRREFASLMSLFVLQQRAISAQVEQKDGIQLSIDPEQVRTDIERLENELTRLSE